MQDFDFNDEEDEIFETARKAWQDYINARSNPHHSPENTVQIIKQKIIAYCAIKEYLESQGNSGEE